MVDHDVLGVVRPAGLFDEFWCGGRTGLCVEFGILIGFTFIIVCSFWNSASSHCGIGCASSIPHASVSGVGFVVYTIFLDFVIHFSDRVP